MEDLTSKSQIASSYECATQSGTTRPWVVIAAWNEAERLPFVLDDLKPFAAEVVVVDDGSRDATADVAAAANVWVLRHLINRGQGAALRTGIDFALSRGASEVITFDADGQHLVSDLPAMLAPLRAKNADMTVGSRFLGSAPGIPFFRIVLLKLATLFTRLTTGLKMTDAHNGLRAMTAEAARKLTFSEDGMAHASQILSLAVREQLRVQEVPCTIRYTSATLEKGQSNRAAFRILGRLMIARLTR
jgi:polyprenyl-phospho-N-acetylgalactosaminyl synthase